MNNFDNIKFNHSFLLQTHVFVFKACKIYLGNSRSAKVEFKLNPDVCQQSHSMMVMFPMRMIFPEHSESKYLISAAVADFLLNVHGKHLTAEGQALGLLNHLLIRRHSVVAHHHVTLGKKTKQLGKMSSL